MLAIKVLNTFIDLDDRTSLRFKLKNPFFSDDFIEGSYTLSFTIPATDKNRTLFTFPDIIESEDKIVKLDADIYLNHELWKTGTLTILETTITSYRATFATDASALKKAIENLSLKDIDWGDNIEMGNDTDDIVDFVNDNVASADPVLQFPRITNPELYGDKNPDFGGAINAFASIAGMPANAIYYDSGDEEVKVINNHAISPQFRNFWVLSTLFEYLGWQLNGDFIDDDELYDLLIYNNFLCDNIEKRWSWEVTNTSQVIPYSGSSLAEDLTKVLFDAEVEDEDNSWAAVDSSTLAGFDKPGKYLIEFYFEADMDPLDAISFYWVKWNWVSDTFVSVYFDIDDAQAGVVNSAIWEYNGDATSNEIFLLLAWNHSDDDESLTIENVRMKVTNLSSLQYNMYAREIVPENHIPDISVQNYLVALKQLFCLGFYFDHANKILDITFNNTILAATAYTDLTKYVVGELKTVFEEYKGYTFKHDQPINDEAYTDLLKSIASFTEQSEVDQVTDLPASFLETDKVRKVRDDNFYYLTYLDVDNDIVDWKKFAFDLFDKVIDEGDAVVVNIAPPLMQDAYYVIAGGVITTSRNTPYVKQAGSSNFFDLGKNDFGLRFMLWRGLQNESSTQTYPMASTDVYNSYDSDEVGDYSLKWGGPFGLYETFWKKMVEFRENTKVVEVTINLPIDELLAIDFKKKYRIFNVNYLIFDIDVRVNLNNIGLATFTLYKT